MNYVPLMLSYRFERLVGETVEQYKSMTMAACLADPHGFSSFLKFAQCGIELFNRMLSMCCEQIRVRERE